MPAGMKVHTVIARALAERGVTHVFGLLGDGNLFVVDDLVREWGITYVAANREDGAVLMADAYARTGDRLAVATVTHGPGLTNTVTALHEAARNRTPLIVLCGDTAPEDRAHNQDIDQRATVLPTGAAFYQLRGAVTAVEDVAIAVRQATVERRPVVLNLPVEIQTREAIYEPVRWEAPPIQAVAADPEVIDRAVGLIATARRPVVLAGSGAVQAGARGALLRLAEALRAPVATTLKASGLFRGQPFDLGLFGTLSSQPAVQAISQADCIVAFGAGLNRYTTSFGAFLDDTRVVQVDIDRSRIGHWGPVDVGVVGDARTVADTMVDWLAELAVTPPGLCSPRLQRDLANHDPASEFEDRSTAETVDARTFTIWLNEQFPDDRTVVTDVGGFMSIPLKHLRVTDPRACVLPANFGSVGLSMGATIGAAIARPDRPVVAVTGDGGFMMGGLTEFNTAVRYGVDAVVAVL